MRLPQFCLSLCSERTRVLAVQVMLAVRKLAKCLSQNSLHSLKWSLVFFFFFFLLHYEMQRGKPEILPLY